MKTRKSQYVSHCAIPPFKLYLKILLSACTLSSLINDALYYVLQKGQMCVLTIF